MTKPKQNKIPAKYHLWNFSTLLLPFFRPSLLPWALAWVMEFFNSAVTVLQTLVVALGAGLGIWGAINLLEGYGNDNPGAKSQGMKQLMAGGGVALIGITLVPLLSGLFG